MRYKTFAFDVKTKTFVKPDRYIDGGQANWYDMAKRENIFDIVGFENFKLGKYLQNTSEDIHHNEVKYLQLFYILEEPHTVTFHKGTGSNEIAGKLLGNVFLCTDANRMVGQVLDNTPFDMDIEVSITCDGYSKKTWIFNVNASSWDKIIFKEIAEFPAK